MTSTDPNDKYILKLLPAVCKTYPLDKIQTLNICYYLKYPTHTCLQRWKSIKHKIYVVVALLLSCFVLSQKIQEIEPM